MVERNLNPLRVACHDDRTEEEALLKSLSSVDGDGSAAGRPAASDHGWLDKVYRANLSAVSRRCQSILKDPEDAADATHEVFLTAVDSLQPGAGPAQTRAWLLTVARNHCLDVLRRRKRLGNALLTLGADTRQHSDMETAVADRDFVNGVIKRLPIRERQALWQSAVEHRPIADIADHLRLSYMAAAQVLHRARRHAFALAMRTVAVLVLIPLSRVLRRASLAIKDDRLLGADRLVAVLAVPLIVAATQSSSSHAQAPARSPTVIAQHLALPSTTTAGGSPIQSNASPPSGAVDAGKSAISSTQGSIGSLIKPLLEGTKQLTPAVPTLTVPTIPSLGSPAPIPPLPVAAPRPSAPPVLP